MADDKPTAGWGRFEGEKLLIGKDPSLELSEVTSDDEVAYTGAWWPNGRPDRERDDGGDHPTSQLFAARGGEQAWEAAVEIARQTKARLIFDGRIWDREWERLDADGSTWAERARGAEGRSVGTGDDFSAESLQSGGVALEFDDAAPALGGTERWEFTPEGVTEEIRRFGLIPESNTTGRDYIAAVPILAEEASSRVRCVVAVVGEGCYEQVGRGRPRQAASALRRTVLQGLAGEYVEERLIGTEDD